jgi:hypothetical protein
MQTILSFIIALIFITCKSDAQNIYEFYDPTTNTRVSFNRENDSTLLLLNERDTLNIKDYVSHYFSDHPSDFSLVSIEISLAESAKYLIYNFTNSNTGFAYKVAFNISISEGKFAPLLDAPGGYGHSCSSTTCTCCGFLKDKKGQIYGCLCWAYPMCDPKGGVCAHTITTNQN